MKTINEMSEKERIDFFEENVSPLIRYGYQEAIDELIEWMDDDFNDEEITIGSIRHKLMSMMDNKRQVNWEKLRKETEPSAGQTEKID